MARAFFDTNVLVYADDADAGAKADQARKLLVDAIQHRTGVVSTQVLVEYYAVARKKLGLDPSTALQRTRDYAELGVVPTDAGLVLRALELHQRVGVSHWDALIVQAALDAGCTTLYSEDLQPGRTLGGLRIVNPFM